MVLLVPNEFLMKSGRLQPLSAKLRIVHITAQNALNRRKQLLIFRFWKSRQWIRSSTLWFFILLRKDKYNSDHQDLSSSIFPSFGNQSMNLMQITYVASRRPIGSQKQTMNSPTDGSTVQWTDRTTRKLIYDVWQIRIRIRLRTRIFGCLKPAQVAKIWLHWFFLIKL